MGEILNIQAPLDCSSNNVGDKVQHAGSTFELLGKNPCVWKNLGTERIRK